jgi:hypothetical protein
MGHRTPLSVQPTGKDGVRRRSDRLSKAWRDDLPDRTGPTAGGVAQLDAINSQKAGQDRHAALRRPGRTPRRIMRGIRFIAAPLAMLVVIISRCCL